MIPLKLQLKNFISYGPSVQTIDFEPYHLICLSGKNGHGKSALLDALTWALWGQARKAYNPSKADDGLMRLGQTNMMVALDFRYAGIIYRVRREYTLHGTKAISHLDFGIIDENTNQLRSLSEKTIRATQEKIIQTIRLDYDSFINSAFLRQGQSNEFSKKSARERKEILATILGIDRYEGLRKKAAEKVRMLTQEKEVLSQTVATLYAEINQKGDIEARLHDVETALQQRSVQEQQILKSLENLAQQKHHLDKEKQAYTKLSFLNEQNSTSVREKTDLALEKITMWRSVHRTKTKLPLFQALAAEMAKLETKVRDLQKSTVDYRKAQVELDSIKAQMQMRKEELIKEQARLTQEFTRAQSTQATTVMHLKEQLSTLTQKHDAEQLEYQKLLKETETIKVHSKDLQPALAALPNHEKLFERRKAFYQRFIARGNALKKELKELVDKNELVEKADACCPLCNQQLSGDLCSRLKTAFAQKHSLLNHQITRITLLIQGLKELLVSHHQEITDLKQQQQNLTRLETRLSELTSHKARHEASLEGYKNNALHITQALQTSQAQLSQSQQQQKQSISLESAITRDALCQNYLKEAQSVELRLSKLAQEDKEYQDYCNKLAALSQQNQANQALLIQLALQDQRKQEIQTLSSLVKKLKGESLSLKEQLDHFKEYEERAHLLRHQEEIAHDELKGHRQQKEGLIQQKGALDHHKAFLEKKEKEVNTYRGRLDELIQLNNEYQALSQAFSKDGIQALLIEDAIPEIEEEANALLGKLTDNQAHLTIESLRDLKSGSTKETLDIKISDTLGIRPYELFSGGEAFRIDFALRIAISKLLARRAGAALQILIIDEGFGSQDEEGLAHITDALHKIQEDFAKVIVVSHLPTMKEQFPVQFHIHKNPQGSTLRVIEQG